MRIAALLLLALPAAALAGEDGGFDHSHAAFDAFLGEAVSNRGVDYDALATRRDTLDSYLDTIASADISAFSKQAKLAFWINAYNAYTIRLILDAGQPSSIMNLDEGKVWKTRKFRVAGEELTLDELEHQRIRPIGDGRIHAGVNCASKGCPPLAPDPFTASGVDAELDAAARRWVKTNAYDLQGDALKLNSIFDWFPEDFATEAAADVAGASDKQDAAIHFIIEHGAKEAERLKSGELTVGWKEYDWALNKR